MRRFPALLWVILGIVGVAFIILLIEQDSDTVFGLPHTQFAQLATFVAILAAISAGVVGQGTFARSMRHALAWAAVLVLAIAGYTWREELEWVARRMTAELMPGTAVVENAGGDGERVVISRVAGGHFGVYVLVNNARVPMMVDTGASVVTLTAEDASAAGLRLRELNFSVPVSTANGVSRAAPVILDSLEVGSIERRRVPALVAQPGLLESSLLGMSFLDTLEGFAISGDRMVLSP